MSKSRSATLAIMLFLLAFCRNSSAADDKTYSLGDSGASLKVALPDGWTGQGDGMSPPTILLKAPTGKHVLIQITQLPEGITDERLKGTAKVMADHYARTSKEKATKLEEITGTNLHGYMAAFTDASENPGAYRHLTAGVVNCGKTYLAVTVFCDDPTSEDAITAMATVKSFSVVTAVAPASTLPTELHVKSPDETWTLVVPGRWKVSEDVKSKDGKSREVTAVGEDGETVLSLFLDPAENPTGDAKAARAFYLERMQKNPTPMEHLKKVAVGELATLEYEQGSEGFKLHNINAYLSHAGVWVDVHISKTDFSEKTDREIFDAVVKGLKAQ